MESKEIIMYVIIFAFGFWFLWSFLSPSSQSTTNLESLDNNSTTDALLQADEHLGKCEEDAQRYFDVLEKKWEMPIEIVDIKRFEYVNHSAANDYYELFTQEFGASLDSGKLGNIEYPVILLAYRVSVNDGKIPEVMVCNKNGKIMERSAPFLFTK